ncbi:TPA: restriction endonuclease subunit S [Vibrio vulnificus]|uniref:restriction endonuclease subunit S n=1 Tax=Vibrio vulnificus TaxID=672 RepID=UPI001A19967D|nr:restriction endonuclease subunit S [Vibrio vulnificus]ELX4138791.1 restriction endonuclease subunit S [Vibrio vulnificus]MCU8207033.1 restriction endonuclease subunit S [Vibrio vulnificus]HAS6326788.1 restriction endonuclease subunit S [Vibrio vulnificus]HBC3369793.1 restriction endonuclease subunit S [Vibrio vulnificus]
MKPILRFQEFNDPIKTKKIRNFCLVKSGVTPLRSKTAYFENGHIPWVKTTDLNNGVITSTEEKVTPLALKETSLKIQPANSVLVAMYGGFNQIGRTGLLKEPATTNQALCVLYPKDGVVISSFLQHYLNARINRWRRFAASSRKDPNITSSDVGSFPVSFGTITEQQKIADFLTAVDTKINQLTEKHRLLKEYKKGVMQQIFSQQLRFKDKDGKAFPEWEEKHFGEVFGRVTQKNSVNNLNVLTISAQKGLISQLEYFNKSVSAKDVSGYYLLRKGDFAYNKSYSQGYPMGAIKPLKFYDSGVVSTLYICFRPKKGFKEAYFEQFFDAGMLNREIAKIAQEGARNHGLLNVSVKEFFDDIKLLVPHQNEQQKIAQFLQALDSKIAAVSEQIEQTKQFKKGLLQQMFV